MNKHLKLTRKNLSLAATGLALVSWYTTAHGLYEFVFQNWWQAAIISGAIQITLFILNLKLIHYIKNNIWGVLFLWIICITASSTFSYVYISSVIYNDSLYYSDADRIIEEQITDLSLQINEYISNNIAYNKDFMEKYCSTLTDLNITYQSTSDVTRILNEYLNLLKNNDLYKTNEPTISQSVQLLQNIINKPNQHYSTQEIESSLNNISTIKNQLEDLLSTTQKSREDSFKMWKDTSDRLAQYPHFQDAEFIKLQSQNRERENDINNLDTKIIHIKNALNITNNYTKSIKNELQNNSKIKLTSAKQNLLLEMNKDTPNLEQIEFNANIIYEIIISQNIASEDFELKDYYSFKNAVQQYKDFHKLNLDMENILKSLEIPRIDFTLNGTDISTTEELHNWRNSWYKLLNELKNIIRNCPIQNELTLAADTPNGTENIKLLPSVMLPNKNFKRESFINTISEIERAYLANLNIIEKSLNLLTSKYKYMARFSLVSAILLDLIGGLMGIFLYYNNMHTNTPQNVSPNTNTKEPAQLENNINPSLS